jgi:hypothetical protein
MVVSDYQLYQNASQGAPNCNETVHGLLLELISLILLEACLVDEQGGQQVMANTKCGEDTTYIVSTMPTFREMGKEILLLAFEWGEFDLKLFLE